MNREILFRAKQIDNGEWVEGCLFCGGKVMESIGTRGVLFFCCTNYNSCGAIISFDQEITNKFPARAREYFNRRAK